MHYQFDEFILDTALFELRYNNTAVKVEPQVVELLALLVKNADRLVSKEEIYEAIWAGRYVSEAALSSRIKSARQALGDDGKTQGYIRTVHKKGFRFVAPVHVVADIPVAETPWLEVNQRRSSDQSVSKHADKWRPTIAVLPFSSLSSDVEQEYFSDGITTDIITMLSKHRWLNVVARNTTFGYKGKSINIQALGKEISADYVVEGSVQRSAGRIRVNTHLIDTTSGIQKWAEKYDREVADIFALQDEITEKICGRLEPEIGVAERQKLIICRPSNMQAWDCYHLGIYHFYKFTGEDNAEAQRLLKRSQELDDNFADAYAWWAYAVVLGMVYWDTPPTQLLMDQALSSCDKALSFDSKNATFYALRARVRLARCEYEEAIQENEKAISLNPTFAAAHCGLGDSLAYEGRYQESIECFERAIAMSPNDPQLWAFLTYGALVSLFTHDYEVALKWCERAQSIPNCQYWTKAHKMVALAYMGRKQEAQQSKEQLLKEMPDFNCEFARNKLFYLKREEQIQLYIDGLKLAGIAEK
jgi:TolB-like protein